MWQFAMLGLTAALLSACANSSSIGPEASAAGRNAEASAFPNSEVTYVQTSASQAKTGRFETARNGSNARHKTQNYTVVYPLTSNDVRTTAATAKNQAGYRIGAQDVIEISVFKVPELSKTIQVSEAGTINLPLIGEIAASGKTTRNLEKEITKRLGEKYLQDPQVNIFVKEYNSQRVTVEGAVNKPGVFQMQGRISLLQAVAMAQGLDAVSDDTVLIFRQVDGKRMAARYDISEIRSGEAADPQLVAGDVVVAGASAFKEGFNGLLKALPITGLFGFL